MKPTVGSRIATNEARDEQWLGARHVVLGLLSAVIVIATALALHDVQARQVAHHAAQLEAVSNLRVGQLEHWLEDHLSLARFAGAIRALPGLHRRWRDAGDIEAREQLLQRVAELNLAGRVVLLFGELGEITEADQLFGMSGRNPRPISTPNLLAVRVIRGELPFAKASSGHQAIAGHPARTREDAPPTN